jgi:hypothetical protein
MEILSKHLTGNYKTGHQTGTLVTGHWCTGKDWDAGVLATGALATGNWQP